MSTPRFCTLVDQKQTTIVSQCEIADNFLSRFKGLLGRKELLQNHALWLKPCNSIHMFFMRFAIDVVFLDSNHQVVHLAENIKPFHPGLFCLKATSVLELPAGTLSRIHLKVGDVLTIRPISA